MLTVIGDFARLGKTAVEAFLRTQPFLPGWLRELRIEHRKAPEAGDRPQTKAEIICLEYKYRQAILVVYDAFAALPGPEMEAYLRHEFVHVALAPLTGYLDRLETLLREHEEDDLADALTAWSEDAEEAVAEDICNMAGDLAASEYGRGRASPVF